MRKKFIGALTHCRNDDFFLSLWLKYYGAQFGRENLFVVFDGDDWEPNVDLTGVTVTMVKDAPRQRVRNDRFMAKIVSSRAHELINDYHYIVRSDIDEFVCIDPNSGLNWETAMEEIDYWGYTYSMGMDVVHNRALETDPLDLNQPILSQRHFAVVDHNYCKPNVTNGICSQHPLNEAGQKSWLLSWSGGFHRALGGRVRMSNHFALFHFSLVDYDLANKRQKDRLASNSNHRSFTGHIDQRFKLFDEISNVAPMDADQAYKIACDKFPLEKDGSLSKRPRAAPEDANVSSGILIEIPKRFSNII